MVTRGSSDGSVVRNTPAKQETCVQSLGREDPLKKEMATYASLLAWRIPQTEEPGRLQSMGSQRLGHNLAIEPPPHVYVYVCIYIHVYSD